MMHMSPVIVAVAFLSIANYFSLLTASFLRDRESGYPLVIGPSNSLKL